MRTRARMHERARTHTHTCTHAYTNTHARTHTQTHIHARAHAHTHTRTHSRMHTFTHAHTCTCTHMHIDGHLAVVVFFFALRLLLISLPMHWLGDRIDIESWRTLNSSFFFAVSYQIFKIKVTQNLSKDALCLKPGWKKALQCSFWFIRHWWLYFLCAGSEGLKCHMVQQDLNLTNGNFTCSLSQQIALLTVSFWTKERKGRNEKARVVPEPMRLTIALLVIACAPSTGLICFIPNPLGLIKWPATSACAEGGKIA